MVGWNFAAVWDGLAEVVPDRDALVCGDRRVSWADFAERASRLAWWLRQVAGVERGDKVAIDLTNRPEYLETFYAALKLGAVPCNVNFRYQAEEVHYVLDNSDAKALVHGPEFAGVAEGAVRRIRKPRRPELLEAGDAYERALAEAPRPSEWSATTPDGDDLIFLYTGGTTGMPKGVMWRNDDLYRALWASGHPRRPEPPDPIEAARAGKRRHRVAGRAAHARHGAVLVDLRARRRGHRRARRPPGARRRVALGHGGAKACSCSPSWGTCSPVRCSPRSRRTRDAGTSRASGRSSRRASCSAPRSSRPCSLS